MIYELWGGAQNDSKIRHHNRFKNWAGQWPVQIETIHGGFNIEVNVSQIARGLNVDRRTANEHINGFQRSKKRVRNNCITPYYDTDKELSDDSSPQVFYYKPILWRQLKDSHNYTGSHVDFCLYDTELASVHRGSSQKLNCRKEDPNLFFQMVGMGYERKGTILTANINFSGWDSVSYDAVVANAMLDRGLHHSHAITINGASYRARDCLKPQNERKEQT